MARQRPPRTAIVGLVLRDHLGQRKHRGIVGRFYREPSTPAAGPELVVCFADLVGFTALGGQLTAQELATVAAHLAKLAAQVAREPVRLVKTIGDAAMFVGPEAPPLVEAALSLVDTVMAEEMLALRSGIASGTAVPWAGDVYGNAVNVASRVTGVAQAGTVLCTREVHEAARGGFAWSYAGRHRLKGVSELQPLYRARRLATPATRQGQARDSGAASYFERMQHDHPDELSAGPERLRRDIAAGRKPTRAGVATVVGWARS
jgi:adenylate cyclase